MKARKQFYTAKGVDIIASLKSVSANIKGPASAVTANLTAGSNDKSHV